MNGTRNQHKHNMSTTKQANWHKSFTEWNEIVRDARERGKAIDDSLHEQGWKLAAEHGIPRDMCCLHNASIDDDMTGWCKGNPERLKAAKHANYLLNQWPGSKQADAISKAAWNRLMVPCGAAKA